MTQIVADAFGSFLEDAREWSRGREWPARLPLCIWLVWLAFHYTFDASYGSLLDGLNLGIHEFGHLICSPLGQFVNVLGGSLVQCLVPLISFVMFHRQQDYFAFTFSFVWLGSNLHGVARYVADARAMQLDLVSPFGGGDGGVIHDWNWILSHLGLLRHDHQIAAVLRVAEIACLWAGVAWGSYLLWRMMTSRGAEERV